ncbi:MAG: amidohydrolase family protein [Gammaproteobacteria bacterium]|nr:amidohydrolase family protein [Gammaproteobacteria bacterium]MDH5239915.1 amidohydrolase family protein [Gammaproteobacteria bacterium]MDH5260438.1 amidohydrolase family protein [Gammaproteobacteria bacterium]MDH5584425.1 amidohydrolase family protein [Gammaproteobacteria bacterium]
MNNPISKLITTVLVCLIAAARAGAETTVFVNVNIVPMNTDEVVAQQSLVVIDGRIAQLGHVDAVPVPKGARVVDGTDRYLMPGLAEMHAHVTSTDPAQIDRLASLFVANGITTIRGMLGQARHLELRDKLASGEIFGPRLTTSGPSFSGRSVSGVADVVQKVHEQKAAGYDFIKIHPGLSLDEFQALATTANKIGMSFAGHVPAAAGVQVALQYRMTTIDHLDGYFAALLPPESPGSGGYGGFFDVLLADQIDIDRVAEIVAATKQAGTWNVPTEVLVEQLIDDTPVSELKSRPEMRYVSAATVKDWVAQKEAQRNDRDFSPETAARGIELRRRLIRELYRAGAGLLLGSDAPQTFNVPGFSTHRELQALVAAGLTPYAALRTGTVEVARFLGSNGGIVAVGKDADLVLLDANPLTDIRNSRRIHGVMLRGVWYPAAVLDEKLERYAVQDGR